MIQAIKAPISVTSLFDHRKRSVQPITLTWEGRVYSVSRIGLHHTYWRGRTLYHIFSLQAGNLFFKLSLDTQTLFWQVEQISDGESN